MSESTENTAACFAALEAALALDARRDNQGAFENLCHPGVQARSSRGYYSLA